MKAFLISMLLCSVAGRAIIAAESRELPVLPGEHWWAGVIAESDQMPLTAASNYGFDFTANTAGNQGQPLLVSDHGRFVWCDDPFAFQFTNGVIRLHSAHSAFQIGTNGSTLASACRYASRTFFPPSQKTPDKLLFAKPQFNTWIELTYNQNQSDILKYARAAVTAGYPPGALMIDEGWAQRYGTWEFDPVRFPDPLAMMKELHKLGFKVMVWVCPYISPDGQKFKSLWLNSQRNNFTPWIRDAGKPSRPALMEWWDGFSAAADLTNPQGRQWLKQQLDELVKIYHVDGFKFDGGDADYYDQKSFLQPIQAFDPKATPNQHSELYAKLGLDYPLNEFRACWKLGGQPLAQRLRDKEHNWKDFTKLIPQSIAQGLMGYPFTCPDMIGGGEYLSFLNLSQVDQELVVRAAQCQALMPMMQFSVAPWRVLSAENEKLCRQMAQLHARMGEEIFALAKNAARTGEPIVRSLEYEFPGQGYAEITDEYLLGSDILVAPVQQKGARSRLIVFPPGSWKGDDGSMLQGPKKLEVAAPLSRLPWYRRVAANAK